MCSQAVAPQTRDLWQLMPSMMVCIERAQQHLAEELAMAHELALEVRRLDCFVQQVRRLDCFVQQVWHHEVYEVAKEDATMRQWDEVQNTYHHCCVAICRERAETSL